jgi:hypothetical protein
LIVHQDPSGEAFQRVFTVERGTHIAPQSLPACSISTDILLPEG